MGETEQTFVGEFEHSLDEKGRLTIPQAFRDRLTGTLFITRGLDGCLFILRTSEFESLREKILNLPIGHSEGRTFSRMFASGAECELDRQGRILVPAGLRDYAGLNGTAIVVGVLNRVEVWAKERWAAEVARMQRDNQFIGEQMTGMGL
ncbi:MAG: division/cell wall cluster transcriptional repressor MraZ [Chloroflexi bacterium]|nr:division/cell wall cluster transcriptional repressor MraZ [Chloroflexota bacterium]